MRREGPTRPPADPPAGGPSAAAGSAPTGADRLRRVLRHDLRSPLGVILGRCELLADPDLGGALTPAQARSIDTIRRQAERMVAMLDELTPLLDDLD